MDRVFDPDRTCEQCYQKPFLGVLYVCRQDERMKDPELSSSPLSMDSGVDFKSPSTPRSNLREELEDVGLSNSVIESAENGLYTPDQLETIKAQKIHVTQVIEEQQTKKSSKKKKHSAASSISKSASDDATPAITVDTSSAATEQPTRSASENESRKSNRKRSKATRRKHEPPCQMAYCVRCRPYYKDRMFMSVEAALKGEYPYISADEMSQLRIINSKKLRGIGMLVPPYRPCDIAEEEDDDDHSTHISLMTANSAYSETLQPSASDVPGLTQLRSKSTTDLASPSTDSLSRHGRRRGMRALRLFRLGRPTSRESIATGPLSTSASVEQSPINATSDGLKKISSTSTEEERDRAMWQDAFDDVILEPTFDFETDGSSLPHGFLPLSSHPVYPKIDLKPADAQSTTSSVSDEIEVKGGVALTEEAVNTLTPDIITQV